MTIRTYAWLALLLPLLALIGCRESDIHQAVETGDSPVSASIGSQQEQERVLAEIIPRLAKKRVIYVGETHSNYGHHLLQLEIIQRLYALNHDLAIGLEFFQQPFQQVLDAYIRGELTEAELLAQAEWYDRWIYDYRLYRPILRFARDNGIPLVALNVPMEIIEQVSRKGIDGLTASERAALPVTIDSSDQVYRERLRNIFEKHARSSDRSFDRFMEVQLCWDEGMASQIADYLKRHPRRQMVVLAGSGHLMYGSGIPNRVQRRIPVEAAIVLSGNGLKVEPGISDLVVIPLPAELPPVGLMGVMIGNVERGVAIQGVVPDSAAATAGLHKGDLILDIDGSPITRTADVKIAMLDRKPGDQVVVQILREGRKMAFRLKLGAP